MLCTDNKEHIYRINLLKITEIQNFSLVLW